MKLRWVNRVFLKGPVLRWINSAFPRINSALRWVNRAFLKGPVLRWAFIVFRGLALRFAGPLLFSED